MPTTGLLALALISLGQTADPYPDQVDVLASAGARPNIVLVLDDSGSMDWDSGSTMRCALGDATSKVEQLRRVLNGCQDETDGILDRWADDVNFAFLSINADDTRGVNAGFDEETPVDAIDEMEVGGGTPLVRPFHTAAEMIRDYVTSANYVSDTDISCRANAIVLMSDGDSNGAAQDFKDIVPQIGWGCEAGQFDCMFAHDSEEITYDPDLHYARLYDAAGWLTKLGVVTAEAVGTTTSTAGTAKIDTYSIFFGASGNETLARAATEGNGIYRRALSGEDVDYAFNTIISAVVSKSRQSFGTAAVQNDGIVSGNEVYVSSFLPAGAVGPWYGTTNRYCLVNDDDTQGCFFDRDEDGALVAAADAPTELFLRTAGVSAADAGERGGTEYLLRRRLVRLGDAGQIEHPYDRKLMSWSDHGYFSLAEGTAAFSGEFEEVLEGRGCSAYRLANYLFGFTSQVRSCAGDYLPVDVAASAVGDTMDGSTLSLSFATTGGGLQRLVFTNANDGMLHIYDGDTGRETAAIIPAQLWDDPAEGEAVVTSSYWDLMQRYAEARRRFNFDGVMRLYHVDDRSGPNGPEMSDGLIQSGELAYLFMGLGRGGYAYYLMDVSKLGAGIPNMGSPIVPLTYQPSGNFAHLRETWAAPWVGRMRTSTENSNLDHVAVFASGHEREFDPPQATFNSLATRSVIEGSEVVHTTWEALRDGDAAKLGLDDPRQYLVDYYGRVEAGAHADLECSNGLLDTQYRYTAPPWGTAWPCPEPEGVAWNALSKTDPAVPENFLAFFSLGEAGTGEAVYLRAPNNENEQPPLAYNIHFDSMSLREGDALVFRDERGEEITRVGAGATETGWLRAEQISMHYYSAGNLIARGGLWRMGEIEVRYARLVDHEFRPSVYMVNVDDWADQAGYAKLSPAEQDALLVQRFTSDCGSDSKCTDSDDFAALANMTCPISAEPAVYTEGGVFRAAYVGDECGQIWRFRYQSGAWDVRRLLSLNSRPATEDSATIQGRYSKDYRKIFRKLELVVSRCTGTRAIGVYFNSGNVQTPSALAAGGEEEDRYLSDTGVVTPLDGAGRDVFGVVWDHNVADPADADRTLDQLVDVTDIASTEEIPDGTADTSYQGWYIQLDPSEKALRDPLVLDGVAYFRSYLPTAEATECSAANGENRTYAMNSCTAEGEQTADTEHEQRMVSATPGNIGGGFTVFVPAGGVPVVLEGLGSGVQANTKALSSGSKRSMQIRLWRTNLLD